MEIDIKKINGNEIIDYLNSLDFNEIDELSDISCQQPFIFESQSIDNGKYQVSFSAYFNNWGTDQLIEDNTIQITANKLIRASLEEPFEGDDSAEVLENLIFKWLETHEFSTTYKDDFNTLIDESIKLLSDCQYGNLSTLEEVTKKITKAKTLIK